MSPYGMYAALELDMLVSWVEPHDYRTMARSLAHGVYRRPYRSSDGTA